MRLNQQNPRVLRLETPRVFLPLLQPARYKGAYGRRGSVKSHFFAELLIEDCLRQRGFLAVCIREVQKSLKDSSKRLIEAKLMELGLGPEHDWSSHAADAFGLMCIGYDEPERARAAERGRGD